MANAPLDPSTAPTIPAPTGGSDGTGYVNDGVEVPYNPRFRSFPEAADRPSSWLVEGELCYTQDDNKFYIATSTTTWTQIGTTGSTVFDSRYPKVLFDHYADVGNVGSGEDDLYSDTIAAGQLASNGDKLDCKFGGIFVNSTSTKDLAVYFGGTKIFDSGALSISTSSSWEVEAMVIRESATVVRCTVKMNSTGASTSAYATYTRITGLTLTDTQILKLTGTSGGVDIADNDIVAKLGTILYIPVAA